MPEDNLYANPSFPQPISGSLSKLEESNLGKGMLLTILLPSFYCSRFDNDPNMDGSKARLQIKFYSGKKLLLSSLQRSNVRRVKCKTPFFDTIIYFSSRGELPTKKKPCFKSQRE